MHTHATGDFKNIGPKQTEAGQSYTTQLCGLSGWLLIAQRTEHHEQTHMFRPKSRDD